MVSLLFTLYRLSMFSLGIYIYIHIHMHLTTFNERKDHEFERKQEGVYGRAYMDKEEGNDMIIL